MSRTNESRHPSDGGLPALHFNATAHGYARHLARYVTCASTIRAHVSSTYGVSIPLDSIREMQSPYERARERFAKTAAGDVTDDEGKPFQVRGLIKPKRLEPETVANAVPRRREPVVASDLIGAIAGEFGLTQDDILGRVRAGPVSQARKTIAYVFHERGNSCSWIGQKLGNRERTTIKHFVDHFREKATPRMRAVATAYLGYAA